MRNIVTADHNLGYLSCFIRLEHNNIVREVVATYLGCVATRAPSVHLGGTYCSKQHPGSTASNWHWTRNWERAALTSR